MCGPLGGALDFLTAGPFDMLVTFEAIFPGTIGSPHERVLEPRDRINAALAAHPERSARFAEHYDRTVSQLTGALTLFHTLVTELKGRAGGRAVRQSQPHLRRIRGRCGAESNGQALRRGSGGPGLRAAIRDADRPHLRPDADDPHDVGRAGSRHRRDGLPSGRARRDVRPLRGALRRGRGPLQLHAGAGRQRVRRAARLGARGQAARAGEQGEPGSEGQVTGSNRSTPRHAAHSSARAPMELRFQRRQLSAAIVDFTSRFDTDWSFATTRALIADLRKRTSKSSRTRAADAGRFLPAAPASLAAAASKWVPRLGPRAASPAAFLHLRSDLHLDFLRAARVEIC